MGGRSGADAVVPVLVRPAVDVGFLGALSLPSDFYWVSRRPVPIAGMAYPARADWSLLAELGFGLVVCLTHDEPPYDPSPLGLTAVALDDLYHGGPPRDPAAERTRVLDAARAAAAAVRRGTGVAVHCRGGRGRAGSVLGAALVTLGLDADHVVEWLDVLHRRRGKAGWPESPWQEEVVRSVAPGLLAAGQGSSIRSTAGAAIESPLADPNDFAVPKENTPPSTPRM